MNETKKYDAKNLYYAEMEFVHNGETKYKGPCLFVKDRGVMIEISTGIECDFRMYSPYYSIYGNNSNYIILTKITRFYGLFLREYSTEEIMKDFQKKYHEKYDTENKYKDIFKLVGESEEKRFTKEREKTSKTEIQNTLAIIKPDGVKNVTNIINMIYKEGLKIEKYDVRMLDKETLREHYSHLLDKPFYPMIENYMLSDKVIIMVLQGKNAVDKLRRLMGPTDSTKASNKTIRGKFGTDITYNAIHGSDSVESAEIEINRFFNQKQKRI